MSSCFILNLAGIPVVLMKIIFFSLPPRGARYTVEAPGVVDVVGACWEEGAPGGEEPWGCGTSTHPKCHDSSALIWVSTWLPEPLRG